MREPLRRSRLAPGIEVRPSPIEGSGLFASEPFAAGEVVTVLGGRLLDDAGFAELAAAGPFSGYAIAQGRHLVQDDDDPARFGNHSCEPTTWLVDEVTLVARRPIAPGEELTTDYATMTADPVWELTCRCGAPSCRRTVTAWHRELPEVRARYAGHAVPWLERRPPPPDVLRAFGLRGAPARLRGGQGQAFRLGDVVVKPVLDGEEANWCAAVLAGLPAHGFRLARPKAATDGRWVVDGWAAWDFVDGAPTTGRWPEVLAVGRRLSAALAGVEPPALLRRRRHRWARADRAAWGEEDVAVAPPLRRLVDRLRAGLRPVDLPTQVVHGDLAGNVLFADGQEPAVIDVSPYARPAGFALAVVAVDALAWGGADVSLLDELRGEPEADQLLARAVLFRLLAAVDAEAERRAHEPVVELLQSERR